MTSVCPTSPATHTHIASLSSVDSVPSLGTRGRGRGRGFAYGAVRQPKTIGGLQQRPVNSWSRTDQTAAESCQHWIMDRPRCLCMCLPDIFFMCHLFLFCLLFIYTTSLSAAALSCCPQLLPSAAMYSLSYIILVYLPASCCQTMDSVTDLCHWSLSLILDFWFLISDH